MMAELSGALSGAALSGAAQLFARRAQINESIGPRTFRGIIN